MIKSIIWGEKFTLNVQIYECFINWVVKNCDGPYLGHDIPPFPFPQVIISADLIPFLEWPARRDREGWVAESPPPLQHLLLWALWANISFLRKLFHLKYFCLLTIFGWLKIIKERETKGEEKRGKGEKKGDSCYFQRYWLFLKICKNSFWKLAQARSILMHISKKIPLFV